MIETLYWKDNKLYLLDQTLIPMEVQYVECLTYKDVIDAIQTMKVRGAPAIGVAAAYAMALAENEGIDLDVAAREIKSSRPTAVNLFWAVDQVLKSVDDGNSAIETANLMAINDIRTNEKRWIL